MKLIILVIGIFIVINAIRYLWLYISWIKLSHEAKNNRGRLDPDDSQTTDCRYAGRRNK